MLLKILTILCPIILVILISIAQEVVLKGISNKTLLCYIYAFLGLLSSILMYLLIKLMAEKSVISNPYLGSYKEFFSGVAIGLLVSCSAALIYYLVNKPELNPTAFSDKLFLRVISNISPAAVEEVGFRGGVVHFLSIYFGKFAGIMGGSLPFGIVHLLGRFFGQPVALIHIAGYTLAGVLLSVVYIKYGLFAAFGCHWAWNSFCRPWAKLFSLPEKGGVQMLEGAWTTCLVLLAISTVITYSIYFQKTE